MHKTDAEEENNEEVIELLTTILRTVTLYIVLISGIRLVGKRQIGQLEPSELVVTMLVADLAAGPIQEGGFNVFSAIIAIGTVLFLELLLSGLSLRSVFWRKLLCGKPVILIENGKLLQKNLRATRITLDELMGYLRQKDILDITTVQYAILETGGSLSVFPFPEERPASAKEAGLSVTQQSLPVTVITDGRVLKENLRRAGKDERWLQKQLDIQHVKAEETFLLSVDDRNRVIFIQSQLPEK